MKKVDYFKLINKYIKPGSLLYSVYLPHVVLVTAKALEVAKRLGLSQREKRFIEEAAMLHDIGVVKVRADFGCNGDLPYICHNIEGRKILDSEGLPRHGLVAERHTGVGIFKGEIREKNLPLPRRDFMAKTLPEKIISWADIFFSKTPDQLWRERTMSEARATIAAYGARHRGVFDEWAKLFGH